MGYSFIKMANSTGAEMLSFVFSMVLNSHSISVTLLYCILISWNMCEIQFPTCVITR